MFSELLEPYRGRLLVACSGGADSVALAHAVMQRAKEEGSAQARLVYVDHGLRAEAAAEGAAVRALASSYAAECKVVPVKLPERASLEAAARDARYAALEAEAIDFEADWVLLAHTRSDQVETVLMRILRGTGLVGLAGIPAQRGRFARPLLQVGRGDTEAYCRQKDLVFAEDAMNRDTRFTRSRIRYHWLPALREENPRLDDALCRLADSARDHRQVLDWAADRLLAEHQTAAGLEVGKVWQTLPDALAVRALVRSAAQSGVQGLENKHLQQLLPLVRAPAAGTQELSLPGVTVERSYELLNWRPTQAVSTSVRVEEGYRARRWRSGDRMRPERLKGRSRKLSDLFGDARVPRPLRVLSWVVERIEDGEIVWAEHVGYAHERETTVTLERSQGERAT